VSALLYIDDRHIGEYNGELQTCLDNTMIRANIAIHLAVKLFVSLGYFLNLFKSILSPVQGITFLGMDIDSRDMSFYITDKRRHKLKDLRANILQASRVPVQIVQMFTGLCISMCLAIPGAKLYTSECNHAISQSILNCMDILINDNLREEIQYWEFIDTRIEPFPWLENRHYTLTLSTDSSNYKWGAVIQGKDLNRDISDYWDKDSMDLPIMIKEALALNNCLLSLQEYIKNKRIVAQVDNQAVVFAWQNQYSKNSDLSKIMKDIFHILLENNCSLSLTYVHTSKNPADVPSRALSKSDTTISQRPWVYLEYLFGVHTVICVP
jgi:hypothetical protein